MSEDRVRRYHEMNRDERIEDSDRIAIMALMNELTRSERGASSKKKRGK